MVQIPPSQSFQQKYRFASICGKRALSLRAAVARTREDQSNFVGFNNNLFSAADNLLTAFSPVTMQVIPMSSVLEQRFSIKVVVL